MNDADTVRSIADRQALTPDWAVLTNIADKLEHAVDKRWLSSEVEKLPTVDAEPYGVGLWVRLADVQSLLENDRRLHE